MTGSPRRVSDRDVLLLMAGVVVVVLALNVLSGVIPGMDRLFASAPVLIVVMLAVSGWVLWRVLRRPRLTPISGRTCCRCDAPCPPAAARCCRSARSRRWRWPRR